MQNVKLEIDGIIDLTLRKPYLMFRIEELFDHLDCPSQHPRITRDTACSPREITCQASDVIPMVKKSNESKKIKNKRAHATYRERRRLGILNDAFRKLKEVVPSACEETRKVDVLKMASQYIEGLTLMLKKASQTEEEQT